MIPGRFTPGPWRWEVNLITHTVQLCGGPPKSGFGRYDLTVISFARWGLQNAAPVFWQWDDNWWTGRPRRADALAEPVPGREHHERWFRTVNHPDAHLMATSPELYDALEAICSEFAQGHPLIQAGAKVLAKARGEVLA